MTRTESFSACSRPTVALAVLLLAAAGAGCSDPGGDGDAGGDGGVDGTLDGGADGTGCVPLTCEDLSRPCGYYDDECGGTIECRRGCECEGSTFEEDCPTRPCETVVGCDREGRCMYEPVRCGGVACACAAGECDESTLRSCGDETCSQRFCDPSPRVVDGDVVFANVCVAGDASGACGVCGLGRMSCAEGSLNCEDLELPGIAADGVECDSTLWSSTFIFVDVRSTAESPDGSREAPYATYAEGLGAAQTRSAKGIIIAGSPTLLGPPTIVSGISVYGGFTRDERGWRANGAERPTFFVGAERVESGRLVGLQARDVTETTILSGMAVQTQDLSGGAAGQGVSSYGAVVTGSPELRLVRMHIEAGSAAPGQAGGRGVDGPSGADGGDGVAWATAEAAPTEGPTIFHPGGRGGSPGGCPGGDGGLLRAGGDGGDTATVCCVHANDGEDAAAGAAGGIAWYNAHSGLHGEDGEDADTAPPGQAAPGAATVAVGEGDDELLSLAAGGGAAGADGAEGGGGGGGAAGIRDWIQPTGSCIIDLVGPSGGGGGGGGCGGGGGRGGSGGGLSVGLFARTSSGMVLRDTTIVAGDAGAGGPGGPGGSQGLGGRGGRAGDALDDPSEFAGCGDSFPEYFTSNYANFRAGNGGNAGAGQPGGMGGNGAGGSSFGAYCDDMTLSVSGASSFVAGAAGRGGDAGDRAAPDGESTDQHGCVAE